MDIVIENCSSPGAHFSDNTLNVMMRMYSWIIKNNKPKLPFIDFRKSLEKEEGINDNNARNIYPLLKNCGLVEYEGGGVLETSNFFTNRGLAYLKTIESKDLLEQDESYTINQKNEALIQFDEIMYQIVYDSLSLIINNNEVSYSNALRLYLTYLLKFGKINKEEFALVVYFYSNKEGEWEESIFPLVEEYRDNDIEINVKVRVKNDRKARQLTGEKTRLEGSSYFTSYSYFSSLVDQAGLSLKKGDYHCLIKDKKNKLNDLLEVEND